MVLGTAKEVILVWSTFALFYLGFSLNCSHTIDECRWSLDVFCTDVVWGNSQNKYECLIRAYPNYLKGDVKPDVLFGDFPVSSTPRRVKLNCSTRFNLPNSTGAYNYTVFLGEAWTGGKKIVELRIDDPGELILKDCPTFVREGDNVMCQCSTQHHGSPSPTLLWPRQTNSSILELHDVRLELNMTRYKCKMTWGMKVKTVFYTLIVTLDSERKHMDTTPSSNIVIVSVAGAVGLVIIIMTTVIVIVIIRRKRNQLKNSPSNPGPTEDNLFENAYYVGYRTDNEKELMMMNGDDYAEMTDSAKHETDTGLPDLYASVKTEEGRQTTRVDDYADVVDNKQHGQSEVYAFVVKPKGRQQAMADNSRGEKKDFTHETEVYAVVQKEAKNKSHVEEMYAQVFKSPK